VSLAQWAVESAYGACSLGAANNPFGMKAKIGQPSVTVWTKEYYGGAMHSVQAAFRKFDSIADAFIAHGRYLMDRNGWPEYVAAANCWKTNRDWSGFINKMAVRYATDPNYAHMLIGVINEWQLQNFNLPAGEA
jgi:flagellum-specific peptidoglycan hydrolase FlgJ